MVSEYRVVFKGEILPGFDPAMVRSKAELKLKTNAGQIERLFSGRPAVLKKGISAELGDRYVSELRRIGMVVRLEAMEATPAPVTPPQPVVNPYSSDMDKTQLADPHALSRFLQETPDPSSAPTLIVPPSRQQDAMQAVLPAQAAVPTMVVTPNSQANTHVVKTGSNQAGGHDPERTLIANPEALNAYFGSHAGGHPAALMTGGISLPHSIPDDPNKTQINPAALDAYLDTAPLAQATKSDEIRSVTISISPKEEEAVAVYAPVEVPRPFSAQSSARSEAVDEDTEDAPPPFHADPRLRKWLVIGFAALLLLLWWLL